MCACVCALQTSGLLSRPGLFAGTEQKSSNENSLHLKHLQAPTLYFFFSLALSRRFAISSHLDGGLSKGYSGEFVRRWSS